MVGLRPQRMNKLIMPGEKKGDIDAGLAGQGGRSREKR